MDLQGGSLDLLQSETQLKILNDVDQLRSLGIKDLISLPQIVVCGDTSSGKSSLLEALSGVSFPVGSDVCTRFATELILRRSPKTSAKASISAHAGATNDYRENVAGFNRQLTSLDREEIETLIDDAKTQMGINDSGEMSDDVLRLNISGPTKPNLTLVDLPGYIHTSSHQPDVRKVDTLVRSYLKEPRSIILVVVSGANPIANQKILSVANELDPQGSRSIGVVTKADLLDADEEYGQRILALARNEHERFHYRRPWHIIRCPSPSERRDEQFDLGTAEQELFRKAPWNDFLRSRLGIDNLRSSLCDCLLQQIRLELPGVITEIKTKIKNTTRSVEELGKARNSSEEQRRYLTHISRRYEQLTRSALTGDYLNTSDPFFAQQSNRLRAQLRDLTDAFELAIKQRGHAKEIRGAPTPIFQPKKSDFPQLVSKEMALKDAEALIKSYRGLELPGMFNPVLVSKLFREQSAKWVSIAREYASQVCAVTSRFITQLLQHICPPNSNTSSLLFTELFDRALELRAESLENKILELMTPYTDALPYSTKSRLDASLKVIEIEDQKLSENLKEPSIFFEVSDVAACSKLLQWSRAYYNVALENFIDNVTLLGVENCISARLVEIFSPDKVAELSDKALNLLGGESAQVSLQRANEHRKLEVLQRSLETCQKYVNREVELAINTPKGLTRELDAIVGHSKSPPGPVLNFQQNSSQQGVWSPSFTFDFSLKKSPVGS